MEPNKLRQKEIYSARAIDLRKMGYSPIYTSNSLCIVLPEDIQDYAGVETIDLSAIDPKKYHRYIMESIFFLGVEVGERNKITEIKEVLDF